MDVFDGGVVAEDDDAVWFACGDSFVGGVDATVELVGLPLEAVLVGTVRCGVAVVAVTGAAEGGIEGGEQEEGEVGLEVVAGSGVHGEDA